MGFSEHVGLIPQPSMPRAMFMWKKNLPGLVNSQKAIENVFFLKIISWFTHQKNGAFPKLCQFTRG